MNKILLFSLLSFIAVGSVNAMDNQFPLHEAADRGDIEQMRSLLSVPGINVNQIDRSGSFRDGHPVLQNVIWSLADKNKKLNLLILPASVQFFITGIMHRESDTVKNILQMYLSLKCHRVRDNKGTP